MSKVGSIVVAFLFVLSVIALAASASGLLTGMFLVVATYAGIYGVPLFGLIGLGLVVNACMHGHCKAAPC